MQEASLDLIRQACFRAVLVYLVSNILMHILFHEGQVSVKGTSGYTYYITQLVPRTSPMCMTNSEYVLVPSPKLNLFD